MLASVRADLARLLEHNDGPCLSLYQPTQRSFPDSRQNPIRYKNLLKELQRSLGEKHRPFGPTKSSTSRVMVCKSGETRYTPANPSSILG